MKDPFDGAPLDVAQARARNAFDLAAHVPKSLDSFYDNCHFTNEAARVVAECVDNHLTASRDRN